MSESDFAFPQTQSWMEANGKIRSLRKNTLGSEIFIQESLPVEWILDCEEHYNQDKLHHDVANWSMFTMFFMWVCWCLTSVAEQIKNTLYLIVFLFHNACIRKKQHLEKCSVLKCQMFLMLNFIEVEVHARVHTHLAHMWRPCYLKFKANSGYLSSYLSRLTKP